MSDIINLRPHHLLCILTYVGHGYTPRFVKNFDEIIEKLNTGKYAIKIINGADDICAPRLCDPSDTTCHCHTEKISHTDNLALNDLKKIIDINIGNTIILTNELINMLRAEYKNQTIRSACQNCEWFDICNDISGNNFAGTKLK